MRTRSHGPAGEEGRPDFRGPLPRLLSGKSSGAEKDTGSGDPAHGRPEAPPKDRKCPPKGRKCLPLPRLQVLCWLSSAAFRVVTCCSHEVAFLPRPRTSAMFRTRVQTAKGSGGRGRAGPERGGGGLSPSRRAGVSRRPRDPAGRRWGGSADAPRPVGARGARGTQAEWP